MAHLDAVFEFRVPGLLIDAELAGRRLHVPGSASWVQFPDDDAESTRGGPFFRSQDVIAGWNEVDGARVALVVNALAIGQTVEVDSHDPEPEVIRTILRSASPHATVTFSRLGNWLRAERSHRWLGRAAFASSRPVAGGLYDAEGRRLDYGYVVGGSVDMRQRADALSPEDAGRLVETIATEAEPALWDMFLADANSAVELHHSVVLAAIACEIAIKTSLQGNAASDQRQLVDLLLNNPRDYSLAVASLFDRPCKAVLGKSLKEDDRDLFTLLTWLFEDRNKVVHKSLSGLRNADTLRDEISAASKGVDWLRDIASAER
jgi:hypothetical protein